MGIIQNIKYFFKAIQELFKFSIVTYQRLADANLANCTLRHCVSHEEINDFELLFLKVRNVKNNKTNTPP